MKTAEKNLWRWFKGAESEVQDKTKLHWQRVENSAAHGTPDVAGCYDGVSFDVELKSVEGGKKIRTGLTASQAMFLRARHAAGGRAWLLIEVAGQRRYLISGYHCDARLIEPTTETYLQKISVLLIDETPIEILSVCAGK